MELRDVYKDQYRQEAAWHQALTPRVSTTKQTKDYYDDLVRYCLRAGCGLDTAAGGV